MVKRYYYKSFLEECKKLAGERDIVIWGARRTGRELIESALENNIFNEKNIHWVDIQRAGQEEKICEKKFKIEQLDKYLENKLNYYIISAAERIYTAVKMEELYYGKEKRNILRCPIMDNYANYYLYIEELVKSDSEKIEESMEEYDNLVATLFTHQNYVSDLIVGGEYQNVAPITTKVGCPIKCKYCPQDVLIKNYLKRDNPVMELSFEAFVGFLSKIPRNVIISFTGFVEPFANPNCLDMILYALEQGYIIRVFSTLYNVSIDDYCKFKDNKNLKTLDVHLPDSQGNTRFPITEAYKKTLKYVVDNPPKYARLWTSCLGINSRTHDDIRNIISVHGNPINSVHGLVYDNRLTHGGAKLRCNRDCSRIDNPKAGVGMILPNGDVVACTQDWELQNVIGNINDVSSWDELMQSDLRNKFRDELENPDIDNICTYCELAIETDRGDKI